LSTVFGVATVCAVGSKRRFTVTEAARVLGVTESAVRGRINRGTLEAEREGGTVYVRLSDEQLSDNQQATDDYPGESNALTSALEARIESLERQLTAERSSSAELRRLLAAALERIPPQLEAPSEPRESPETATEAPGRGEEPRDQEHVPWWRRWFQSR
jgi:predicted transcriptional regulator